MIRKIIYSFILFILIIPFWYFIIKSYDYKITFTTTNPTGVVYHSLQKLNEINLTNYSIENISSEPFSKIIQEFVINDSIIGVEWMINRELDSLTRVTAFLDDKSSSNFSRFTLLFMNTPFKNRGLQLLKRVRENLKRVEKKYKVSSVSKSLSPSNTHIYINSTCKISEKAKLMINHNDILMDYITDNNLEFSGKPFVEIEDWNVEENLIVFNFCFPIKPAKSYSFSDKIKVKSNIKKQSLKIEFNGNYRISHYGWYYLLDYAKRNSIDYEYSINEYFFNDPHNGGNDLEWVTQIYLPIKTKAND